MHFDLADLRAFVAVADLGSFRSAAETIHLSQPALSRRIDKLEEALGVRLFDRDTRNVNLTAVGRDFSRKAHVLLNDLDNMLLGIHEMAAHRGGAVTIASVPSAVHYFLPDVIRQYHAKYPRIRLSLIDASANDVLSAVLHGEADFGLNFTGSQEPEIDFRPILRESFVVACHRELPLARKRKVTWSELKAYDYMTVDKTSGNRLLIDLALADVSDRPQWCYETRHVSTLVGFVEAKLGIAVVPRLAMPARGHPSLVSIPLVEPAVTRTVGLVRRRGRSLSPAAEALYNLVQQTRPKGRRTSATGLRATVDSDERGKTTGDQR